MRTLLILPLVLILNLLIFASASLGQNSNTALRIQKIGNGDFDKGLNHIVSLAKKGNGTATFIYALLHRDLGKTDKFLKYLELSAHQGNPVAMKFLGTGYFKGALVKNDFDKAKFWFEKSAQHLNVNSMVYLGIMHRDGLGVETNVQIAYFWFTVAGELKTNVEGHKEPEEFAEELEAQLSAADIQKIVQDVKSWILSHPKTDPLGMPPIESRAGAVELNGNESSQASNYSDFLRLASRFRTGPVGKISNQTTLIQGLHPQQNPGQQRDIKLILEKSDLNSRAEFIAYKPKVDFSHNATDVCRLDWMNRCKIGTLSLRNKVLDVIRKESPWFLSHSGPYLYIQKLGATDNFLMSYSPYFDNKNDVEIVATVFDKYLNVHQLFRIEVSNKKGGIDTGAKEGSSIYIGWATQIENEIIMSISSTYRCTPRPRKTGFLVSFSIERNQVNWVSPMRTSDGSFAIVGDISFAANGGSCEKDYLYAMSRNSGNVIARSVLTTAADWLVADDLRLYGKMYSGGFAYKLLETQ